jgi:hypothetical protein
LILIRSHILRIISASNLHGPFIRHQNSEFPLSLQSLWNYLWLWYPIFPQMLLRLCSKPWSRLELFESHIILLAAFPKCCFDYAQNPETVALLCLNMAMSDPKDTCRNVSKLLNDPNSLSAKLSHRLVLTGWWTRPNYNLVLNCAGLSKRFLRQKLQDGRCIVPSEFTKSSLCSIHQNGWHIAWGTQLERWVLCLESRCYNKSHSGPKLMVQHPTLKQGWSVLAWITMGCHYRSNDT